MAADNHPDYIAIAVVNFLLAAFLLIVLHGGCGSDTFSKAFERPRQERR